MIQVENKNLYYADLLLNAYAGEISEDTAIHEYVYQHILLKSNYKELSEALLQISITEMHHLSYLGETIKCLGKKPIFCFKKKFSNNYKFWDASSVNYETDIKKLLIHNIKSEDIAIQTYKKLIEIINDKYIRVLLEKIIEDEKKHIRIFNTFLDKIKKVN